MALHLPELLVHPINGLPLWNWTLQGIGVLASYIGAELNSRGSIKGFSVWIFSNIVLAIIHIATGLWLLFMLDLLYLRVNIKGLRIWRHSAPVPQ